MDGKTSRLLVAICALLAATFLFALHSPLRSQSGLSLEGRPDISFGASAIYSEFLAARAGVADPPGKASPAVPMATVPMVDLSFEGFGFDDNITENNTLIIPPDAIGAAGHSRVIAVVNSMIEARTKDGDLKWRDSLRDFYAPLAPGARPFDPKVVYDPYEDRFVVVALELIVGSAPVDPNNISRILLAVSKAGNPLSATPADWNYHAINAKQIIFGSFEGWADYPGFEVDEEAVYVTANIFTFVPFGFNGGVRLWIVDKGSGAGGFYDGGPAGVTVHNPYAAAGLSTTTMPAEVRGAGGVGGPGSTLGTFLVSYSGLTTGGVGGLEAVQVITVDDPLGNIGGPFFLHQFVFLGDLEDVGGVFGFPALPDAPQNGSAFLLEVNDRRALDAAWRGNSLWMTTTINPNAGPDAGETTAHWVRLDTSGAPGPIPVADQGDIGGEDIAPATTTFFPSVAVNRLGDAKFGFSASAASIYAGAYVTGREAGDAPGTVQTSQAIKVGEDFYFRFFGGTRNRWGDYSGISVDPSNDRFFWVFNQFADQRGTPTIGTFGLEDGRWGTAWGRCKFK